MIRRILPYILWTVFLAGLFISMGFSNKEHRLVRCKNVDIVINHDDDNYFVEREDVIQLIRDNGDSLINQPLWSIDIPRIESVLNAHPSIDSAEVYEHVNGDISIYISQRKPIARILTSSNESYYMDSKGLLMPLSSRFTAHVPVFDGRIIETYGANYHTDFSDTTINDSLLKTTVLDDVFSLAKYISADEFWNAQIVGVTIGDEITLTPRVGNHRIILGDSKNLEEKFNKLYIFYQEGLTKKGWNTYSTINLKYRNQVVCSKAN
jgi:cell division protein FtsQ